MRLEQVLAHKGLKTTLATIGVSGVGMAVAVAAYLVSDMLAQERVRNIAKPFAAWAISAGFLAKSVRLAAIRRYTLCMVVAFLLYGIADIAMEYGAALLPLGVLLFLIGHIVFSLGVFVSRSLATESDTPAEGAPRVRYVLCVVFLAVFGLFTVNAVYIVLNYTQSAVLAVFGFVYPLMFAAIAISALLCWRRAVSMVLTVLGTVLFAASDTVIVIQRFVVSLYWMDLFIMSTYWLAMALLACAAVPVVWHATKKHPIEEPAAKAAKLD